MYIFIWGSNREKNVIGQLAYVKIDPNTLSAGDNSMSAADLVNWGFDKIGCRNRTILTPDLVVLYNSIRACKPMKSWVALQVDRTADSLDFDAVLV